MALANNSLINHFSYVFAVLFEPDFEIHRKLESIHQPSDLTLTLSGFKILNNATVASSGVGIASLIIPN